MKTLRWNIPLAPAAAHPNVEVLLDEGRVKVRRIDLAAGGSIPPCRMHEDVVFIVLSGRVAFTDEEGVSVVEAPGAVYIPGRGITRSMKAESQARVLAVLCMDDGGVEEPR
jgi:quercetin dioxygenase-like cupin family protein